MRQIVKTSLNKLDYSTHKEKSNMKKMALVLVLIAFGSIAQATEIKVFEMPSEGNHHLNAYYTIDRNTGEAKVNLAVRKQGRGRGNHPHTSYYRSHFQGLRFDAGLSSVVLDHEGQEIECATVTQRTIFRLNIIRDSGCKLIARRTSRYVNTGHRNVKRRFYEVVIRINE
jgi:hypothetical protein